MINATDNKIMMALNSNGRYSYAKLAKELGVKPTTVAKRVEALLNNDVITIRPDRVIFRQQMAVW